MTEARRDAANQSSVKLTDAERFRIALARIDALERLLACYRAGSQPSEKLHRELARSRTALAEATGGFMPDRGAP